jgi:TadE-like protein
MAGSSPNRIARSRARSREIVPLPASRAAHGERGVMTVEFALLLPLILLFLFGVSEWGLALNAANDQTHIASEIARYAAVDENPGGEQLLQAWGKEQFDQKGVTGDEVCISFPEGAEVGDPVKVEFKSTKRILPVLNELKLSSITNTPIVGTAEMRIEVAPSRYEEGCA